MRNIFKKLRFATLLLIHLLLIAGYSTVFAVEENANITPQLVCHFIDVGQGDCILIQLPNNETMLIDAGRASNGESIIQYIASLNIETIDYFVATHPHGDHVGGFPQVISMFNIGEIYMPDVPCATTTCKRFVDTANRKNIIINNAMVDIVILDTDTMSVKFIGPIETNYSNMNNNSAVTKITYKGVSFLFTGDACVASEQDMIQKKDIDLSANVLKIGHHGGISSTSNEFLVTVNPSYAVISCGIGINNYPHQTVINRLNSRNIVTYRTDLQGTIVATSNGVTIEFTITGKSE